MTYTKNKYPLLMAIIILTCSGLFSCAAEAADECLDCHADRDMVGKQSLVVSEQFNRTAHSELGCQTCHETITEDHPGQDVSGTAIRCESCHEEIAEVYQKSPHLTNAACQDCHDPHGVVAFRSQTAQTMNQTCLACHQEQEITTYHEAWLPQTPLHLNSLPCVTCHMTAPGYEIVLTIERQQIQGLIKKYRPVSNEELTGMADQEHGQQLIDVNGDQLISIAELKRFRNSSEHSDLRLHATLVPAHVSHNLMTLDNRYDCTFCHASGRKTVQSGYLILPTDAGNEQLIPVAREAILEALYGNRDLYITGITRSASLDILGLIIICSGFIMPVGHGTLRFLTRKNRRHEKDEP